MKKFHASLMLGLAFAVSHFAGCESAKPEPTKEEIAAEEKRMDKEIDDGESRL